MSPLILDGWRNVEKSSDSFYVSFSFFAISATDIYGISSKYSLLSNWGGQLTRAGPE